MIQNCVLSLALYSVIGNRWWKCNKNHRSNV